MMSRAQVLVIVLALCGTLGCSAGSPEASSASPAPVSAPTPESASFEGGPEYPEPPGLEALSSVEKLEKAPTFTPYTVQPELKNREWVARMLAKEYPPLLREQRVGGRAWVWILTDATGQIRKIQLRESTGNLQLDEAALRVAAYMEFTPAYNKDTPVPVWNAVPITFTVRR